MRTKTGTMRIETICKRTKHLTMVELPTKARVIHDAMSGNPHFPAAAGMLAELDTCRAAMEEANQRCLFYGGLIATAQRHDCRAALEAAIDNLFHYVKAASRRNVSVALSSGFTLRKAPLLLPVPGPPQNVRVRRQQWSGALQLRWEPIHGARVYVVEMKQRDLNEEAPWQHVNTSEAKLQVRGLEPGVYHTFRVRAVLAAGVSPYSQLVVGMAA
jgi:hypothetical protein